MSFTYKYARPALTVDCVIFGFDAAQKELRVLLIQRGMEPFKGRWALPGGFVKVGEDTDTAARRELEEETGVKQLFLEQFHTFSDPRRDPREHVVSVAYFALVPFASHPPKADTDASDAAWFAVDEVPSLAFDHKLILGVALQRLRQKIQREPSGFELLPREFTLTQLQQVYEAVLGTTLDKRNFRKKILAMDLLVDTGEVQQDVAHRAAALWKFDARRYEKLKRGGFHFAL